MNTPERPAAPTCLPETMTMALKVIEGRWKIAIIHLIFNHASLRFSELRRGLPGVSQKVLTQQLREMERDGLIGRKIYPEVPPRVEYWLTDSGRAFAPVLKELTNWAEAYRLAPIFAAASS